jgi:hypothetical protein
MEIYKKFQKWFFIKSPKKANGRVAEAALPFKIL